MTLTKTLKGVSDRDARKLVATEGKVVNSFKWGPYTMVEMTYESEGKIVQGFGQSRRSPGDSNRPVTGFNTAKAAAVSSIVSKCKGKFPHHFPQG